jgi:hypothetical protein
MRLFHQLSNYRYFWKIWNKFANFKFKLNRNSYYLRSELKHKSNNIGILVAIIKKYLPELILVCATIFFLEWLEAKSDLQNFVKNLVPEEIFKKRSIDEIYPGIAALFTAFITIYFASISILASTSYLKLPTETKSLIWKEKGNYFLYNYLMALIVITIILSALNNLGYSTGYIVFIATILLSLFGIMAFVFFSVRLFGFFSPVSLLEAYFVPNIQNLIKQIIVNRKQFPELQTHCQRLVESDLTLIENIIRTEFLDKSIETSHSGEEVEKLIKQLFQVLTYYSSRKQSIPLDSLWYKKRSKHKSYFEVDFYSDISFTHQLDTTMIATEIPDLMWLEKKVTRILELIFSHIFLTKNYRLCAIALNTLQVHLEFIIEQADHNTAILILDNLSPKLQKFILDINPKFQEFGETLKDNSVLEPLAIADCYGCIFISAILGYRKRVEGLFAKIDHVDFSSKKGLYAQNFPSEIIASLEDLQKKLKFEIAIEGKIITEKYYIDQLVATAVLEFINSIPDKVIRMLDEEMIKFSAKLLDQKNYIMLLPLFDRILEALNKSFSFANQLKHDEEAVAKFIKVKDIPHIRVNVEDFHKKLTEQKRIVLEYFSKLSGVVSLIPKHDSVIPDYFGNFYFRLSQLCVEAIVKNDAELFSKIFPAYFSHSFSVYNYLCKKFNECNANKEYWATRISDVVMNLFIISGYALIYREIGQKEIWQVLDKEWKSITEILKRDSLKDALHAMIQIASTNTFYVSSTNQIRFEWERLVISDLFEKKIIKERDSNFFGREPKRRHQSDILEILSRSNNNFHSWHYGAEVVFIACYLEELPDDKGSELIIKAKRFAEDVEGLKNV